MNAVKCPHCNMAVAVPELERAADDYQNLQLERAQVGTDLVKMIHLVREALSLAGGWREAICILEDVCSEPVRLKNMIAAANQLDEWTRKARGLLSHG